MKQIAIKPIIHKFENCDEFAREFQIGKNDLVITNAYIYKPNFDHLNLKSHVIYQEVYSTGEPSNLMIDQMCQDIKDVNYKRVIAIGGGSVLDTAKLFALKKFTPSLDLFEKKFEPYKDKELILVPTTCGTGSEVTNLSILDLKERNTKLGLASEQLFADHAVLIPKLLIGLPFKFFAYSAIDALIHAMESAVSPNKNSYSIMYAYEAIRLILEGFKRITTDEIKYNDTLLLEDLLIASNYAGISFVNVGAGAVHAMSYPVGGKYLIAHGEVNYALFIKIFRVYTEINPEGEIKNLNKLIAEILNCRIEDVYQNLEIILNKLIPNKALCEFGVKLLDLKDFTENVMTKQTRLTKTNYVPLDAEQVYKIYLDLYE